MLRGSRWRKRDPRTVDLNGMIAVLCAGAGEIGERDVGAGKRSAFPSM